MSDGGRSRPHGTGRKGEREGEREREREREISEEGLHSTLMEGHLIKTKRLVFEERDRKTIFKAPP